MNTAVPRLGLVETEGAGPPVVLLHGFGGCAAGWGNVQNGLGKAALAFDLPGHASSLGYPGFGSVSFAAKAVLLELDRRGITEFHLAGHSMGGAIAALVAIGQPSRVLSATLLAPGGVSSWINAPLLRALTRAANEEELALCLRQMFAPSASIPPNLVKATAAQRRVPGQQEALAHILERILRGEEQGIIPRAALEALAMPVTVIWGAEDAVMPGNVLQSLPGHFRTLLLPDVGHMLLDEAPEHAAGAIIDTVARADAQILPRR
jgi:pyruvate dehydrogenase E2 component (dihydrolipoamide acetyltransferase)